MAVKRKRETSGLYFVPVIRKREGKDRKILEEVVTIVLEDHNRLENTSFVLVKIEKAVKEEVCGLLWYLTLRVHDTCTSEVKTIQKVAWQGTSYQVHVIGQDEVNEEDYSVDDLQEIHLSEPAEEDLAKLALKKCIKFDMSGYKTVKNYTIKSHGSKHADERQQFIMSQLNLETNETDESFNVIMVQRKWVKTLDDAKAQSFFKKVETSLSRPPQPPVPRDRPLSKPVFITYNFDLCSTDKKSPHIETIAWFALQNHNFIKNQNLEFVKVVGGFFNLCYGIRLYLTLSVREEGIVKTCTTKVFEKPDMAVWLPSLLTDAPLRKDQYLSWASYLRRSKELRAAVGN